MSLLSNAVATAGQILAAAGVIESDTKAAAERLYRADVRSLADGKTVDPAAVHSNCVAIGRSVADMQRDVAELQSRLSLIADYHRGQQAAADVERYRGELQRLEDLKAAAVLKHDAKLGPVADALQLAQRIVVDTSAVESELIRSAPQEFQDKLAEQNARMASLDRQHFALCERKQLLELAESELAAFGYDSGWEFGHLYSGDIEYIRNANSGTAAQLGAVRSKIKELSATLADNRKERQATVAASEKLLRQAVLAV